MINHCSPPTWTILERFSGGEFGSASTPYARSRRDARRGRFWSTGSRDSRHLLDLSEIKGTCRVDARRYAGLHTVPIEQNRGSEGRSNDLDRDFHPLQDHCMGRWLRVARARDQDKVLPPVVLVQVGDAYFVRDGHHRISVARALGQLDIDADVTVWHLSGPSPWDAPEQPSRPGLADRFLGMGHAFRRRWLQGLAGSVRSAPRQMTANRLAEG
jgi:hypothetical protein